jgi:hypothetical protein
MGGAHRRGRADLGWLGPNDTTLTLEIDLAERGRKQRVFIQREVVPPDLEFVHLRSAVGMLTAVDLPAAVKRIGQLVVGGLGYLPHDAGEGILSLDVKFPTCLSTRPRWPLSSSSCS